MALHTKWSSGDQIWYDGTQDIFSVKNSTGGIVVGEDEGGVDAKFFGGTASAYMLWDASEDDLVFSGDAGIALDGGDLTIGDTDYLIFGDGTDVTFTWSTGDTLDVAVTAANTQIDWGTTGAPIVHKFFGTTGTAAYMKWDSSGSELVFDLADISMGDTDFIKFGDDDDITLDWDGGSFNIVGTSGNADVEFGTASIPLRAKFFGTSGGSNYMQWDSSGSELIFSGSNISMDDTERIKFGTTGNYIYSSTSSQLDVVSEGTLYLNGEITYPAPNEESSTAANITLTSTSNRVQFLASTGNVNVIVPVSSGAGVAGIEFKILATTGADISVCEGSTSTVITTIGANEGGTVISDSTHWRGIVGTT